MANSPWFAYTSTPAYAKPITYDISTDEEALRLFCFPHAGGGASSFRDWVGALAPEIEVLPIQLPGRETRFLEEPYHHLTPLLDDLLLALQPYLDRPFAFFGHSLGALMAFELTRKLRDAGQMPQQLFVSGYGAPHLPVKLPPMHHLDDAQFAQALQKLDTVPTAVLENEELFELLLPALRTDFSVFEQYEFVEEMPINCPLTMIGGINDPLVTLESLAAWAAHTTLQGEVHLLEGDHFYLQEQQTAVWQIVRQSCLVQQSL